MSLINRAGVIGRIQIMADSTDHLHLRFIKTSFRETLDSQAFMAYTPLPLRLFFLIRTSSRPCSGHKVRVCEGGKSVRERKKESCRVEGEGLEW